MLASSSLKNYTKKISIALTITFIPALVTTAHGAARRTTLSKALTTSAAAPARKAKAPVAAEPEATHEATHEAHQDSGSSSFRLGAGFSTMNHSNSTVPSLSALFQLNGPGSIQANFGIDGTSGAFTFNAAGIYRHTLSGNAASGFHVGGGLILGTAASGAGGAALGVGGAAGTTDFAIRIAPLAGFHFQVPHAPVLFSLDGGATVTIVGGSANFQVGGLSSLLGISAHYLF